MEYYINHYFFILSQMLMGATIQNDILSPHKTKKCYDSYSKFKNRNAVGGPHVDHTYECKCRITLWHTN
jgi:hypothetical protein